MRKTHNPPTHTKKYSKGKYFYEMFPPKNKLNVKPFGVDVSELLDPSPFKTIMLETKQDNNEKAVKNEMKCVLTEVKVMLQKEDCVACLNTLFTLYSNNVVYTKQQVVQIPMKNWYYELVVIPKNKIIGLCCIL